MITQSALVAALDQLFNVGAFQEPDNRSYLPTGYESVLERFAVPGFLTGGWNGLQLSNTTEADRVYLVVSPGEPVLDKVIAREVERGAPGSFILCHHPFDYQESGPGFVPIPEAQLEELREHKISLYICHAPLDCHPEISTSSALAASLKVRDQERFAPYYSGLAGVRGKIGPVSFQDLAKKVAEVVGLSALRYDGLRHNGKPVQQVGIVAGYGGTPDEIREALAAGCDTFITGEWWPFGPGDWRSAARDKMREFLTTTDVNLIAASHYASEAVVLKTQLVQWFQENVTGADAIFIPQDDPWR